MLVLAVETSCDETSASIVQLEEFDKKNNFLPIKILSNIISSQVKIHQKWGGVVPNLAAREHVKNIVPVLDTALKSAGIKLSEIDVFATTQGPGLIPALLIGTNASKALAYFYQKPLVGVHHIEGHIYANFVRETQNNKICFPIIALVVSGGHTQLMLIKNHLEYEISGQTLDDAVGEAFDKVAKMLDLGYPGGPIVSTYAEASRKNKRINKSQIANRRSQITLPRPMLNSKNLDFSFSGLKTAVLYSYQKSKKKVKDEKQLESLKKSICQEFENAAVEVLVKKTRKAIEKYRPETFLLAGGVAANRHLRDEVEKMLESDYPEIDFKFPPMELCGDNAAMIAIAATYRFELSKNKKVFQNNWKTLEANANLALK